MKDSLTSAELVQITGSAKRLPKSVSGLKPTNPAFKVVNSAPITAAATRLSETVASPDHSQKAPMALCLTGALISMVQNPSSLFPAHMAPATFRKQSPNSSASCVSILEPAALQEQRLLKQVIEPYIRNATMIISLIAVILFVGLVGVALLGGRLGRLLPEEQLSAESKDAVKLAMGLIATMTAVLLGLLISSAKGTFDTAQSEVMQMAAKVALLDRVLALYGPEAAEARRALRDAVADAARRAWPANGSAPVRLDPNEQMGDAVYVAIHRLTPHDDAQRTLKTQAATLMVQLGELRSLLQAQSIPAVSKPLLIALVSWLVVIFFGFSLVAPANATSTLALVAGAFSVAGAVFLILELDHPFAGVIRIPSEPMTNTLNHLAKETS